jgi:YD repeat-containing protein
VAHVEFYTDYVNAGLQYTDVNGDGKDDLVKSAVENNVALFGPKGAWLSTGLGWVRDDSYTLPSGLHFLRESTTATILSNQIFLLDLNGDGLVDVLRGDDVSREAWLQSPGKTGSRWERDDRFQPPTAMSAGGNPLDDDPLKPYRTRGVLMGDVDGNGTPDFLRAYDNAGTQHRESHLSLSAFPDLLQEVENGQGGSLLYAYASLVAQRSPVLEGLAQANASSVGEVLGSDPDERPAWAPIAVVASTAVTGIATDVYETEYFYADPRWDARLRAPLGIRLVYEWHAQDGSVVRRYHHQRHGYAGRLRERELWSAGGQKLRHEWRTWERLDGGSVGGSIAGVLVGRVAQEGELDIYAGGIGPWRTTDYAYDDSHGFNFAATITHTRITGGLTVTRTAVPRNDTQWVAGLVDTETHASGNVVYRSTTYGYKSGSGGALPLLASRSSVNQTRASPPDALGAAATELWDYDPYGNVTSHTDAEGRVTLSFQDGDALPAVCTSGTTNGQALLAARQDPLGGVTCVTRDATTGEPTLERAFNGDRTITARDPLGRVTQVDFDPFGASQVTLETRGYVDDPLASAALRPYVEVYRHVGDGTTVRTASYFDGLGRAMRDVRDGAAANQWIGVARSYDYAGRATKVTQDQPCSDAHCSALVAAAGEPGTTMLYDALGRVTERNHPGGRYEKLDYRRDPRGPFDGVLAMDPEGRLTLRAYDGERLALVDECSNTVSPTGSLAGATCTSPKTTAYAYAPTGELALIQDAVATGSEPCPLGGSCPAGRHETALVYDTLGRRIELRDPNAGTQSFEYDRVGNLLAATNARGQRTAYSFDALDRVTFIDRPEPPPPALPEKDVTITYDDSSANGDWTRQRESVAEAGGYAASYLYL